MPKVAKLPVAPFVGAWIETKCGPTARRRRRPSHPSWVRGLKQCGLWHQCAEHCVAPFVGAWIETEVMWNAADAVAVAPFVGAWIETPANRPQPCQGWSHPSWVRGLKHLGNGAATAHTHVAPFVGAWIETSLWRVPLWSLRSHPSWVRGLKQSFTLADNGVVRRTLRGCVD